MENHCKIVEDGWTFMDYELSALQRSLKKLKPLLGSKDIQVLHDDYAHSGGPAVCFFSVPMNIIGKNPGLEYASVVQTRRASLG